jgi:hypothetical protein
MENVNPETLKTGNSGAKMFMLFLLGAIAGGIIAFFGARQMTTSSLQAIFNEQRQNIKLKAENEYLKKAEDIRFAQYQVSGRVKDAKSSVGACMEISADLAAEMKKRKQDKKEINSLIKELSGLLKNADSQLNSAISVGAEKKKTGK